MGLTANPSTGLTVAETETDVVVTIDLPGMSERDLEITVEDGILLVKGERTSTVPEGAKMLFSNRAAGEFERTLKIHDSIDPSSVDAVMEDGVLTIRMTRRPELKARKINIKPASA